MKLKIIQVIVVEDDSSAIPMPMPTPKADKYHIFLMTGKELCKISNNIGLSSGLDVIMSK